ncbi:MAG: carboxypeptidase-like regulatory domain-containing protein [Candidatus Micrarchaeia archaeon]
MNFQFNSRKTVFVALIVLAALLAFVALSFFGQQQAARLSVSVSTVSGAPIEGALVKIVFGGKVLASSVTLGNGTTVFDGLPASKRVTVRVEKEGFEGASLRITLSGDAKASVELTESPQATLPLQEEKRVELVIASRRDRLNAKYGREIALQVEDAMNRLAKAASTDGVNAETVFFDEEGAPFTAEGDVAAALTVLNESGARYLLLVGGPKIVSMPRAPNPLSSASYSPVFEFLLESDSMVWTDLPYSAGGAVVGRLPDGFEEESRDSVLVDLLEEAIQAHSKRASFEGVSKVVSQDVFFDFLNRFSFEKAGEAALVAPPFSVIRLLDFAYVPPALDSLREGLSSNVVFVALHGNEPLQEQAFIGRARSDSSDYLVLNPSIAREIDFAGKILVADSCYGANPQRTVNESLAIKFLRGGAKAFVGSTMSALSDNKLSSSAAVDEAAVERAGVANALTYFTLKGLASGERIGDAFVAAKKKLGTREVDELTALEFILYGDPTLRV